MAFAIPLLLHPDFAQGDQRLGKICVERDRSLQGRPGGAVSPHTHQATAREHMQFLKTSPLKILSLKLLKSL